MIVSRARFPDPHGPLASGIVRRDDRLRARGLDVGGNLVGALAVRHHCAALHSALLACIDKSERDTWHVRDLDVGVGLLEGGPDAANRARHVPRDQSSTELHGLLVRHWSLCVSLVCV